MYAGSKMLVSTKDFAVTVPSLLFDPDFHVFDFAIPSDKTKFLVVEESNLDLAPFIDVRFEPMAQAQFSVSTRELFALEQHHDIVRPRSSFIFHHAFVCSTLLARSLNQIDAFFSLKEPWILRRLADFKRVKGTRLSESKWREMFTSYIMLLAKNYRTGESPVIKVTNVANNLLVDVMKFLPEHKILYLYSDLKSFLVSNLKKTAETQQKIPALAAAFLADGRFVTRFPQFSQLSSFSFLQLCALIWIVSLYNFQVSVKKCGHTGVKTLDMQTLLEDFEGSLRALSHFFGHTSLPGEIENMMDPTITGKNSKDQQQTYSVEQREFEVGQVLSHHGLEIEKTMAWIHPIVETLEVLQYFQDHRLER